MDFFLFLTLLLGSPFAELQPEAAELATASDARVAVVNENLPLLERPYRRGHVYGNTVRRRHRRGAVHFLFDERSQSFDVPMLQTVPRRIRQR